jgi:hypothetical protein
MLADTSAAGRVAAATPAERDRFADVLRVASIVVVALRTACSCCSGAGRLGG